jgi:hypothetical protein
MLADQKSATITAGYRRWHETDVGYSPKRTERDFKMSGYNTVLKIRRLEEEINKLGFRWGNSKHGAWGGNDYGDVVALFPKDDCLPIYSRDAEMFTGTIEQLEVWLQGFQKAREYDRMLMGKTHEKKRKRLEQDYRNLEL